LREEGNSRCDQRERERERERERGGGERKRGNGQGETEKRDGKDGENAIERITC